MTRACHTIAIESEDVRCPHCDGDMPIVLLDNLVDVEDGIPGRYVIGKCTNCELVFLSRRPTPDSLPRCYTSQYHVQDSARQGFVARVLYGLRTYMRRRRMCAAATGQFRSLLEIGCGDASFLRHLDKHLPPAIALCGIDLQAPSISEGRLRVNRGEFEKVDFGGQFDLVVMFNVLEHLQNPGESLRAIYLTMMSGGTLYGEVPDWNSIWRKSFPRHWQGLQIPRHMTFFTPMTLRRTLEAAGFQITSLRGSFDPGDLAVTLCNWITDSLGLATPPRKAWFFLPIVVSTAPVAWLIRLMSGNSGCLEFTAKKRT
jgi:SAM-dependent methyltransferase